MTVIANIWSSTYKHAQTELARDLNVAQNIFQQVLEDRKHLLFNSADVLTADFGFKQAVATADKATIKSALINHGNRIEADIMVLLSLSGDILTSAPEQSFANGTFAYRYLIENVINEGGTVANLMLGERIYQVVMLTVDAPTPIAIALIGFEIDKTLVGQLKSLTGLETTISVVSEGQEQLSLSTLNPTQKNAALASTAQQLSWFNVFRPSKNRFVSSQFELASTPDYQLLVTLSDNLDSLFGEFTQLLFNISLIALIAIVLALCMALFFSKKITRPLIDLVDFAQKAAKGNYHHSFTSTSKTEEFNTLVNALDTMQNDIREREQEISFQAQHDMLTKLYNRHYIGNVLGQRLDNQEQFQIIGVNILGFRGINDVFGYSHGDSCLCKVASRLPKANGIAARLTGGELLWVPDQAYDADAIAAFKQHMQQPVVLGDVEISIKLVFGIMQCPQDASNAEELFRRLNIVLDESRKIPARLLHYDAALEQHYLRRLSIISELKKTLSSKQQELRLVYQPKLDLRSSRVIGAEALIRWNSEALGFVSPEEFIAVAEGAGFIEKITQWVLQRVVEDLIFFKHKGLKLNVAVNLSAQDLIQPQLAKNIIAMLEQHELTPDTISFEITEGDLVNEVEKAIVQLKAFQSQGFKIAIDDFGTGYSSMAYLQQFPANTLKIDKAFILNLDQNPSDQRIAKTIVDLAHDLNMTIVAEGVENLASLKILQQLGCEYAQGYFISKPKEKDEFVSWVNEHTNKQWLE